MRTILGPIRREKLVLCSADASPDAQRHESDRAAYFFPNAAWVGAVRNCAERLNCKFVILTTGHGLVEPDDIINPFDAHIERYRGEVAERWEATIPLVLREDRNSLVLFYAGGCPKEPYIEISKPIFRSLGISLLSFGRPNMFDVDKIEDCAEMLFRGTSLDEIASILKQPDRLEFHYNL